MKHVGILGGSFDPIHNGHIAIAKAALAQLKLEQVFFIPTAYSPMKPFAANATDTQRIKMIELAIEGEPSLDYLDWEIVRGGTSYSIDTVRLLKKNWPSMHFYWIIGADLFETLPHWKDAEILTSLISFIIAPRPNYTMIPPYSLKKLKYFVLENVNQDMSSTLIRAGLKDRKDMRDFLRESVYNYILINRLYDTHGVNSYE